MTDTGHPSTDAGSSRAPYGEPAVPEPTAWTGWVAFAGFMMILLGTFQAIEGLVAVFDDGYYLVRPDALLVNVDYSVWGWVHLLLDQSRARSWAVEWAAVEPVWTGKVTED